MPKPRDRRFEIIDCRKRYGIKMLSTIYDLRSNISNLKGFTLVEMLVVIGIMGLTIGSTLVFLTSVIKGSNQANVTAEVKQTGQVVLDSLERQIRNGIDAQLLLSDPNSLKITRSGLSPLYIRCFPSVPETKNGWIGTVVRATDPTLESDYTSLTSSSELVSGVDMVCSTSSSPSAFNVIPSSSTSPAIVTVNFTVNQAINAPSRQDFLAKAEFQTTISLRQY